MSKSAQTTLRPITFGLVHGAWHGAWCWDKLTPFLERAGHQVVVMDLPIDKLSSTFETYADSVIDALRGYKNIILVGHSRAGNVIPRVASKIDIQGLIYLAAAISPAADFRLDPTDSAPKQESDAFNAGIIVRPDGLTEYLLDKVPYFFYQDCAPEDRAWAISNLRPQNRSDDSPPITGQPVIPTDSIYCAEDRIRNSAWCRWAAKTYLGVEATEFPGGHSPFISQPELLADTLLELAAKQQKEL